MSRRRSRLLVHLTVAGGQLCKPYDLQSRQLHGMLFKSPDFGNPLINLKLLFCLHPHHVMTMTANLVESAILYSLVPCACAPLARSPCSSMPESYDLSIPGPSQQSPKDRRKPSSTTKAGMCHAGRPKPTEMDACLYEKVILLTLPPICP